MKRFDKDSDGKLSDEERAAAHKEFGQRRPGGPDGNRGPGRGGPGAGGNRPDPAKMRAEFMKQFDKDSDGKLSDDERAAARKQFEERRGGGRGRRGPDGGGKRGERPSDDAKPAADKPSEDKPADESPAEAAPSE